MFDQAPGVVRGTCRLGISELIAATWFPRFIAQASEPYPSLLLEPHVDLTRVLERKLVPGELDLAIIPGPPEQLALDFEKIGELEYRWMTSSQRMRAGTVLKPHHLANHPIITLSKESRLARVVDEWAEQAGVAVPKALVCNSLTALIALAVSGVGISYFPRTYLQPFVRAGKLVELASPPPWAR